MSETYIIQTNLKGNISELTKYAPEIHTNNKKWEQGGLAATHVSEHWWQNHGILFFKYPALCLAEAMFVPAVMCHKLWSLYITSGHPSFRAAQNDKAEVRSSGHRYPRCCQTLIDSPLQKICDRKIKEHCWPYVSKTTLESEEKGKSPEHIMYYPQLISLILIYIL